jgi:hypothetical protein
MPLQRRREKGTFPTGVFFNLDFSLKILFSWRSTYRHENYICKWKKIMPLSILGQGGHALTFIIGGTQGLSPALKKSCREIVSLSPLAFPRKLSLVVLLEQIYRAFTILKGHPYHK